MFYKGFVVFLLNMCFFLELFLEEFELCVYVSWIFLLELLESRFCLSCSSSVVNTSFASKKPTNHWPSELG